MGQDYSDRIVLPAERVKTNRQHMIFLTKTMRDILDSRETSSWQRACVRPPTREPIHGMGRKQDRA